MSDDIRTQFRDLVQSRSPDNGRRQVTAQDIRELFLFMAENAILPGDPRLEEANAPLLERIEELQQRLEAIESGAGALPRIEEPPAFDPAAPVEGDDVTLVTPTATLADEIVLEVLTIGGVDFLEQLEGLVLRAVPRGEITQRWRIANTAGAIFAEARALVDLAPVRIVTDAAFEPAAPKVGEALTLVQPVVEGSTPISIELESVKIDGEPVETSTSGDIVSILGPSVSAGELVAVWRVTGPGAGNTATSTATATVAAQPVEPEPATRIVRINNTRFSATVPALPEGETSKPVLVRTSSLKIVQGSPTTSVMSITDGTQTSEIRGDSNGAAVATAPVIRPDQTRGTINLSGGSGLVVLDRVVKILVTEVVGGQARLYAGVDDEHLTLRGSANITAGYKLLIDDVIVRFLNTVAGDGFIVETSGQSVFTLDTLPSDIEDNEAKFFGAQGHAVPLSVTSEYLGAPPLVSTVGLDAEGYFGRVSTGTINSFNAGPGDDQDAFTDVTTVPDPVDPVIPGDLPDAPPLEISATKASVIEGEGNYFATNDPPKVRQYAEYMWDFGESWDAVVPAEAVSTKDMRYSEALYPIMAWKQPGTKTVTCTRTYKGETETATMTMPVASLATAFPGTKTVVYASNSANHTDGAPAGAELFTDFQQAYSAARARNGLILIHRSETIPYSATMGVGSVYIYHYGSGTRRPMLAPADASVTSTVFLHADTTRTVIRGVELKTSYDPTNPAPVPQPNASIDGIVMQGNSKNNTLLDVKVEGHHKSLSVTSATVDTPTGYYILSLETYKHGDYGIYSAKLNKSGIRGCWLHQPPNVVHADGQENREINGGSTTVNAPSHGVCRIQRSEESCIDQSDLDTYGGWTNHNDGTGRQIHQPGLRLFISAEETNDAQVVNSRISGGHDMVSMYPTNWGGDIPIFHPVVCRFDNVIFREMGFTSNGLGSVYDGVKIRNCTYIVRKKIDGIRGARLFNHIYASERPRPSMDVTDAMTVDGLNVIFYEEDNLNPNDFTIFEQAEEFTSVPDDEGAFNVTIETIPLPE